MSAFDDLTLGELDDIVVTCLDGKAFTDPAVDPLKLAGGVMWMTHKRSNPALTWDDFRYSTNMGAIKRFSEEMEEQSDAANPTQAPQMS